MKGLEDAVRECRGSGRTCAHSSLGEGAVLSTLVTFFRLRKCLTLARRESGQVSLEAVRDIQLYLDKDATVRFLIKALIIELVTLGILQLELGVSDLSLELSLQLKVHTHVSTSQSHSNNRYRYDLL